MWNCTYSIINVFGKYTALLIGIFFSLIPACYAEEYAGHKILILNSYHRAFQWTENQVSAANEVLSKEINDLELFVEYMDTKRIYNKEYLDTLYQFYKDKYKNIQLSAIITTDDNALWFVEKHHREIFGQAPVFFSGINNRNKISTLDNQHFTGIFEDLDVQPTIELALKLHPQTKKIVVLVDSTPTGIEHQKAVAAAAGQFKDLKFDYIESKNITHDALVEKLRNLPSDCIVLLAIWLRDKNDVYLSPEMGGRLISSNASVPVYGIIDMYFGYGIVGGKLLSSRNHGRIVAEETVRALNGKSPGPPVMPGSINPYMLDDQQLKRWNISIADLPPGSIIIHQPNSFYDRYKQLIWGVCGIISFLILIVAFLTFNILRRKNVEQRLQESEKKIRLLIDNAPIGIATVGPHGNFVSTNPAYEKMLGYSKKELSTLSFYEVTHPDYRPENKELFKNIFSTESTTFKFEKVYVCKNGDNIDVSVYATPVLDDRGKTIFGTAFVEDITDRKRAETEFLQSKQLIDSVINGIEEPIFVKDEQHRWIIVNDAFCMMLRRDREELIGKTDHDIFPAQEAAIFWERDNEVLHSKKHDVNEETLIIEGQTLISSTSKSSFTNPITGRKNIVGIIRDITETKRIEEQLQQAQKMESVGRLAGGVAHDFNNMLSIIIGYAESALETVPPDTPLHEDLTEIFQAGVRSADITRQLLAFARQQTTAPQVLDLNISIDGVLKMLRRLIGEDIELAWRPRTHLWQIKIDPSQIDQILANLCVNARDSMPNVGQITIETKNISFDEEYCADHAELRPGDYVMLSVSDNGSGMSSDVKDKIFEPFFTTKSLHHGTGLGLSTVYGIVKQNNGFINVYSEVGSGTTVKIYLPRHTGPEEIDRLNTGHAVPQSKGETILLVEDDTSILKLGETVLNSLEYTVLAANSPAQAIQLAEEHLEEIDLLITDVVMPEMNGRELAGELQRKIPALKILYTSGYTANVIAHRGVLEEGVNFIPKPLSKKDLAAKVREVLDDGQA